MTDVATDPPDFDPDAELNAALRSVRRWLDAGPITLEAYYKGRDVTHFQELTDELRTNAQVTVDKTNELLRRFGQQRAVNSGWRPAAVNAATPGAAPLSQHMWCRAIDLSDPEGDLDEFLFGCTQHLIELGLWMEHPASTKGWTHVQTVPPKSGKLVFYP